MVVKKQAIKPVKSATSKTTRAQSTSRATQKRQIQKQIQKQNSISAPSKKQSKKKARIDKQVVLCDFYINFCFKYRIHRPVERKATFF